MRSATAYRTARDLITEVTGGHAAPSDIAAAVLTDVAALDPRLNCFAWFDPEAVMAQARALDARIAKGEDVGALAGLPVAIKDLIAMKGAPTAFGSRLMAGNVIDADAPATERIRAAGAVLLGKSTTSEFGCKAVGDSPLTGITRNPWNPDCTPGGSSAGAAALAASGITPVAIGTDGGGSVRIPASLTGLFAIKAQFGRVPVWPVSATASLAHVGPLSRDVRDSALMMGVISGFDARDPAAVAGPVPDYLAACERDPKGLRVLYSETFGYARPDAEVAALCRKAMDRLAALGCAVEERDFLFDDPADIWASEFYSGVGTRLRDALATRPDEIDPGVAAELRKALARDVPAYFTQVFERYAFRETVRALFEGFDAIAGPTLPVTAVPVGRDVPEGHGDRSPIDWVYYTYPFNLTGHPAVSINAGFTAAGMPTGLQLVGRPLAEETLFTLAAAYQDADPERERRPDL
ncbi:MAG: amidase [Rhodospirillales bacterium CG15_BIG_FIL_POST_REV_8_21_14_020_66_15]|nr:MAG: amidase [Rhodospirillales bacterium CG15_BIG_FIL_POST_REV_8_21_14_020_66_15]